MAVRETGEIELLELEYRQDDIQTWKELAEAVIADLGRYALDVTPERGLGAFEAFKRRAALLEQMDGSVWL
jgi:hypothetical protein